MAGVGVERLGTPVQDARNRAIKRKLLKMSRKGRFVINPRSTMTFPINYTLVASGFSGSLTSLLPDGRITLFASFSGG
jgi:hypothetical protein